MRIAIAKIMKRDVVMEMNWERKRDGELGTLKEGKKGPEKGGQMEA